MHAAQLQVQATPDSEGDATFRLDAQVDAQAPFELSGRPCKIGLWDIDLASRTMTWTPAVYQIYGLSPGDGHVDLVKAGSAYHPDDRKRLKALIDEAVEEPGGFNAVLRLKRRDGAWRKVELLARARPGPGGVAVGLSGIIRDVTDESEQEALSRSQAQLISSLIQHVPAAIAILDRNMAYLAVNDRWISDHGLATTQSQILGQSHYEIFPDVPEAWKDNHRRALAGEKTGPHRQQFKRANGESIWVDRTVAPWTGPSGSIGGIMILVRVVTREVEGEHLASKANRRLVALLDRLPEALVLADAESGVVVYMNDAARSLIGESPDKSTMAQLSLLLSPPREARHRNSQTENGVAYAERRFEICDDRGGKIAVVGSGRFISDEGRQLSLHVFRRAASA